jgi:RimJ/RimL family protein N-acetyltransferase
LQAGGMLDLFNNREFHQSNEFKTIISKFSVIKKLEKSDWRKFREIRLEALEKSPDSFVSVLFEEENKKTEDAWIEYLENSIILAYFVDDKIVGCCGLLLEKRTKIAHTATLFSMYVKDEMRGNGIGLQLINAVKDCAKNNDVKHLYLGCNAENRGAVRLYKKCGFKVYGTKPNYSRIGDKFYDDLIMMCEL